MSALMLHICFIFSIVFNRKCTTPNCSGCLTYDGRDQCVVNMKHLLFTYEVLREFMFHFLIGGCVCIHIPVTLLIYDNLIFHRTTIFSEYRVLVKAHEDAGNSTFSSTVHYNHFRCAWFAYLSLLDIDFIQGFQCIKCGGDPQMLIMDATGLSFRRELDFWKENLIVDVPKGRVPKGK